MAQRAKERKEAAMRAALVNSADREIDSGRDGSGEGENNDEVDDRRDNRKKTAAAMQSGRVQKEFSRDREAAGRYLQRN